MIPPAAAASQAREAEIPAMPPGVRLISFENGLTLIVREDHSAPVVSAQAWCKAGSIDEGRWLGAGLSHVLEHMLFKGTTVRGTGRIDQEIQEAGGYMNAYTSFDRTVYWINVPNTGAQVAVDVLCDVMQHATLPADELAKEMDVIRREMDMCHDDPGRRASRRLFETAYTRSPYRFTVIGYPDIFSQIQRADVVTYYQEKYCPNNIFFVVAGDVRTDEVVAQVRQAFTGAKARPLPPSVLPEEPRQMGPREVIEEAPIELGHLHLSWHIPEVRHPDVPLLDVLAVLLGGGRSSRLFQEVREKQGLVTSIDAWTYSPGHPGLFGMSASVESARFGAAREAMLLELEKLRNQTVAPEELGKAVKQFIAGILATRKTMQGQAQDLGGNWMAAEDLNFSERYLAAVKRITPADLRRVAQQYLTPENRTLYALLPTGGAPAARVEAELSGDHSVERLELPNGLRLLLKPNHRLPFVEFRLALRGGVLAEAAECSGSTQLLAKMMMQGTASLSAGELVTRIESLGGHIDTYSGNNSFGINAEVLSGDFAVGLELVADVLLHPAFPAEALGRERDNQLAAIKAQRDQILQSGARAMRHGLFGQNGYGLDPLGTEQSVTAIQLDHLREFHRRLVVPREAVLAIYGDIDPQTAVAAVRKAFGEWPADDTRATVDSTAAPHPPVPRSPTGRRITETRDKKQAVLLLGYPGASFQDEERFALEVLQEACSDLGSRLFLRIREKLGLAYYVGAQNFVGLIPGYFAFYLGTAPEKLDEVERELQAEAELLRTEGLTAEELKRAKAKIIGQKKIARQDLGSLAQTQALDELYGLGYDNCDREDARFEAVTLEEVRAAAGKYLRTDACVIAVVRP